MALGRHEHIRWFDVSMHDEVLMGVMQCAQDLDDQRHPAAHVHLLSTAIRRDCLAIHVLEHEIGTAVPEGAAVQNLRDRGVYQRG